jgi:hypothetical protein
MDLPVVGMGQSMRHHTDHRDENEIKKQFEPRRVTKPQ